MTEGDTNKQMNTETTSNPALVPVLADAAFHDNNNEPKHDVERVKKKYLDNDEYHLYINSESEAREDSPDSTGSPGSNDSISMNVIVEIYIIKNDA